MLVSSAFAYAQPTTAKAESSSEKAERAAKIADDDDKRSGNKVELPPEKRNPVRIPRFDRSVVIDGRPDESVWATAAVFKDFYQVSPGNNTAPSKPTEVLVFYDEKNLYIAFKCWDDRDQIRASVANRDNVEGEDNVRVWLDTFDDRRRAYVLAFNPFGIQQDGIYTEGRGADFSVDIVMESKGVIEDWGWSVEVKIPFKSLRYLSGDKVNWGFNAARNIDRFNDEMDQWMPDNRDVSGFLIKSGKITGLSEIKYEKTLELVPNITVSETGRRTRTVPISTANANGYDRIFFPIGIQDPGRFVNEPLQMDVGLNLRYNFTSNMTLTAAFNPDFAEIEADAPVVVANQRFPIYFQEKRPFFLEGKEIFETPIEAFYSRAIIDPDAAVKLTGKVGKNTFGFLVASDNAPGNYSDDEINDPIIGPRIRPFVDKNATFAIVRAKRDIGPENSIGFLGTARIFPQNRNFVGGFDGKFKLDPKTIFTFQVLGSHSRKNFYDPNTDRNNYRNGNGVAYFLNLDYTAETNGWMIEAEGNSPDYRADSGFTGRTNTNSLFLFNRFSTKTKPEKLLMKTDWNQFARYRFDWYGRTQEGSVGTSLGFTIRGSTSINMETGVQLEKIYEDEFGPNRDLLNGRGGAFAGEPFRSAFGPYASFNVEKKFNKQLFGYAFIGSIFQTFDFDFGAGGHYDRVSPAFANYISSPAYLQYISDLYLYQADPTNIPIPELPGPPALDPGRAWQFDLELGVEYTPLEPLKVNFEYSKTRLRRHDNGAVAFDSNIFTTKTTYQFTRFLFTRVRFDYDSLSSNAAGQALFGWTPNPGTAFYVGYNDNFNYGGFSPLTGQYEPGFERNSRTFFIRASYLFRKSF